MEVKDKKKVCEINGTFVYSDKKLQGIDGKMVKFSDGSWVDVGTGVYWNQTQTGYIDLQKNVQPNPGGTNLVIESGATDGDLNIIDIEGGIRAEGLHVSGDINISNVRK